jgi:LPXTG-site transpeptidase (sortase) family protein
MLREKKPVVAKTPWIKEGMRLLMIFVMVFVWSLLFTNAKLFSNSFKDIVFWKEASTVALLGKGDVSVDSKISTLVDENSQKMDEIDAQARAYSHQNTLSPASSLETLLQNKLETYTMDFNILPPTNRVVVPSLNIDVPLVDSLYKNDVDFSQGDFAVELKSGVVKYPTTPDPGQEGNTLIFGHTSQEFWEKNPYGTIFSSMPKLQAGDIIQLIWQGNLYEYKVVDKVIRTPKEVNTEYMKRQNQGKQFVTLMGCYPLGRTDKRMMVIAERVN